MYFLSSKKRIGTIFLMFVMSKKVPRPKDLLQDILPELQLEKNTLHWKILEGEMMPNQYCNSLLNNRKRNINERRPCMDIYICNKETFERYLKDDHRRKMIHFCCGLYPLSVFFHPIAPILWQDYFWLTSYSFLWLKPKNSRREIY